MSDFQEPDTSNGSDYSDSRASSEDADGWRTGNDLFADIDSFIHENVTMQADGDRSEAQIDLDGDDILKQLILK